MNKAIVTFMGVILAAATVSAQLAVPAWTNRFVLAGETYNEGLLIAIGRSNHVIVGGHSYNEVRTSDYGVIIAYTSAGVPLWTNIFAGPSATYNEIVALKTDLDGNVVVTGFRGTAYATPSDTIFATVKYSEAGVPLWTNTYRTALNARNEPAALAVDSNGDVYVTGSSANAPLFPSDDAYLTVKYSSAGVPIWTNRFNSVGGGNDNPTAIALDAAGNVFVTGTSVSDYLTIAYTSAGAPLWTNRYNGPGNGNDSPRAIALDANGNVFVTGQSVGAGSYGDFATIAYSNSGVPLWTNRYSGPVNGVDGAVAVATDAEGNVYVAGTSLSASNYDYTTIKYSNSGVGLWTNRFNGPANNDDSATAAALSSSGDFFVTGRSFNGSYDYATVAYSSAGTMLWNYRYNSGGSDEPAAIAVDQNGNAYVTGYTPNQAGNAFATIKYAARPSLAIQTVDQQAVMTWSNGDFTLQTAPSVTDVFTNIPGATSPYTNVISEPQRVFRLISN